MEDIFLPVMESAVVLASHYAKESGRNTVTAADMMYGLMYSARHVVGHSSSARSSRRFMTESESDEEDIETVDDDEEPFKRYEGSDPECIAYKMNQCADTWDDWEPRRQPSRRSKMQSRTGDTSSSECRT
jgi:hypothetical protein